MGLRATIGIVAGLVLSATAPAEGQETCLLDGQNYPENAVICSGGLVAYCTNGTWQTSEGRRCDAGTGAYLSPLRPFREKNSEPIPEFYKEEYPDLLK